MLAVEKGIGCRNWAGVDGGANTGIPKRTRPCSFALLPKAVFEMPNEVPGVFGNIAELAANELMRS